MPPSKGKHQHTTNAEEEPSRGLRGGVDCARRLKVAMKRNEVRIWEYCTENANERSDRYRRSQLSGDGRLTRHTDNTPSGRYAHLQAS